MTQYHKVVNYWKCVMLQVIEVVKFLVSLGLYFNGENEMLSPLREWNFS